MKITVKTTDEIIKKIRAAIIAVLCTPASFAGPAEIDAKSTAPPPPVEKKEANPLCFLDGKLCFDIQERLRFEIRENNFDFNDSVDSLTDDSWLLQRFRIAVAFKPVPWLKIYAQGQDSREIDSDRPNIPGVMGAEGNDPFDLRQGYIQLGPKSWNVTIGRQILGFGDERLVGPLDWTNFGRTFDAVKMRYEKPTWSLETFTSSVVVIDRHEFNKSDLFNGNELHRDLVFSGLYLSTSGLPATTWNFYVFILDQARGNTSNLEGTLALPPAGSAGGDLTDRTDFVTLGTYIKGDPKKLNGFEYNGELAFQVGKLAGLDLTAFATHAGIGYNFFDTWSKPRIYLEYSFGSGDDNPTDGESGTFQNLFPTQHPFYGYMDLFSWENIHELAASVKCTPINKVTAELYGHTFWLANTNDFWYRANGLTTVRPLTPAARNANNHAGSELDLTFTYTPIKWLALQGGYSHFFAGQYLHDTGADDDADFGYLQATINF